MSAVYPRAIKAFLTRHDYTDDVMAAHVNDLQDEVSALERTLGINPQLPNVSIAARLADLENGKTRPVFQASNSSSSTRVPNWDPPVSVSLPFIRPSATSDPFKWFNGVNGFKIGLTGWYTVNASALWTASPALGYRRTMLIGGGMILTSEDHLAESKGIAWHYGNLSWVGILTAGTTLEVNVTHQVGSVQIVRQPRLSGAFIRAV
jgi:hypothetical protein